MPFWNRNPEPETEQRNMAPSPVAGSPVADPSVMMPWGADREQASVAVTTQSVQSLPVIQAALRVLKSAVTGRGPLRAYTTEVTDSGVPYKQWNAEQPVLLDRMFSYGGPTAPATNNRSRGLGETVRSMALFGEAWWQTLATDQIGQPALMQPLYPPMLRIRQDAPNQQPTYEYGLGERKTQLDPMTLTQVTLDTQANFGRGLSSLDYSSVAYGLALAALDFGAAWFANGAAPSYLLSLSDDASEEVVERVAEMFRVNHSGLRNAWLPLAAGPGLGVQKLGGSPEDSQFAATLESTTNIIGSMYGIPPHQLGSATPDVGAWGKTYEESSQQLEDFTFTPFVVPIEESVSALLRPGMDAAFITNLVRPSSQFLANLLMQIKASDAMVPNEIRALYFGLEPLAQPEADMIAQPTPFQRGPDGAQPPDDDQSSNSAADGDGN